MKNVEHCTVCFIIGKSLRLFGSYKVIKGIIWILVVFGCIKASRGVSLVFGMVDSIFELRYFCSEAVAQRSSVKKVFLEISQNSQENTCVRDSFFNKVAGLVSGTGVFL